MKPNGRGTSRRPMREWDGTPFRVDIVRNFPDFVTEADLQQLLDPIGRLADQIELQLGYPVLEMGDLIEVPAGSARPAGIRISTVTGGTTRCRASGVNSWRST